MNKPWLPTALLIAFFVMPVTFGWFDVNRLDCRFCFRDVLVQSLAPVGYLALVGGIYCLAKPANQLDGTLSKFVLLGVFFGAMSFFITYRPLWL